jgi:hypothetical protein
MEGHIFCKTLCLLENNFPIFVISAQVWRERTEDTILSLSQNSEKISESLQESTMIQDTIVHNQIQTLEYQVSILTCRAIRLNFYLF